MVRVEIIKKIQEGKLKAEKHIGKFALFVSFFPQMVQGPISRFDQLQPQLLKGNPWDGDKVKEGKTVVKTICVPNKLVNIVVK